MIKIGVLLSFIPIALFVKSAEKNFKNAQIKQVAAKRRERLDKEHGIDREKWKENFQALDEVYRITEKDELKKLRETGRTQMQVKDELERRGIKEPEGESSGEEAIR